MPRVRVYDRWVSIGGKNGFAATIRHARKLGMGLIDGWKPGMCAWYSFRFKADSAQMKALEAWWEDTGIEFFRRKPRGAWSPRGDDVLSWKFVMNGLRKSH